MSWVEILELCQFEPALLQNIPKSCTVTGQMFWLILHITSFQIMVTSNISFGCQMLKLNHLKFGMMIAKVIKEGMAKLCLFVFQFWVYSNAMKSKKCSLSFSTKILKKWLYNLMEQKLKTDLLLSILICIPKLVKFDGPRSITFDWNSVWKQYACYFFSFLPHIS